LVRRFAAADGDQSGALIKLDREDPLTLLAFSAGTELRL
jgi:hypothetical protein